MSVSARMKSNVCRHSVSLLLLFLSAFFFPRAEALTKQRGSNLSVSAVLVFGDSTVDPGNNNYIQTPFRSNFPPYGREFENQEATGRYTDGRLATDFIVSYVGLKEYVPPYLDPTLSLEELMTGVSFASGGSGFDPLTPRISNTIEIPKQVEYFKEYRKRLELAIGKERTDNLIKKAIFVISAGTNDLVVNYFTLPVRRKSYTISGYQHFLMQHVEQLIQSLWDQGARRIAFVGMPPIGCLPMVITLNSDNAFLQRGCIEELSLVAKDYNLKLQNKLKAIHKNLAHLGGKIFYVDIYGPVTNMIRGYDKFGFEEVANGCCGSGIIEVSFLCNPNSYVCPDASKYIFWDSIHPTEKTYYIVFKTLRHIIDMISN
ncbi:hypothetical protein VitviT2T_015145 [Vitis vinifera]|uniref:GDSL esterase/lipase n=2 Tax=Vitis vinifera TaxID=29760 RepID=A0ABY9CPA1_VITVI|nr:GDSL esterase/lipase At5g45960 [Vitis vinifera]WJZ96458.1 hypothetical protein VitviT2T_015145 [Vitis vinifera]|eukprot:XP_002273045.2 PREDICTED: GDSL esterase/lipase At5g45960 [Vitis vinifera]